jgi:hypothetical protein
MQTTGDLILECPVKINRIIDIKMSAKANKHTKFWFEAETDETGATTLLKGIGESGVKLRLRSDGKVIFQGMIDNLEVENINGYFIVRANCLSNTRKLDLLERKRSFQDKSLTYSDIMHQVFAGYSHSTVVANAGNFQTGTSIIEYGETDWQFMLRMAAKIGVSVIPSYYSEAINVYFGAPLRTEGAIRPIEFSRGRSSVNFLRQKYNGKDAHSTNFEQFIFEDENIYRLGDTVMVNNRNFLVINHEMRLSKGRLEHIYKATEEENAAVPYFENEMLRGLSITGTVLDRDYNNVKIHLDIDEKQDVGTAYWYPYLPPVGNVMYTMPQLGTRVFLRLKSSTDGDGLVAHCQRTNGRTCPEFSDVNKRYHTTEFGKRMAMLPNLTSVSDAGGSIVEEDGKGITAFTGKNVNVHVSGKTVIHAAKQVTIQTPARIKVVKAPGSSEIELSNGQIHLRNPNVYSHSTGSGKVIAYPASENSQSVKASSDVVAAVAGSIPLF